MPGKRFFFTTELPNSEAMSRHCFVNILNIFFWHNIARNMRLKSDKVSFSDSL